MCYTVYRKFYFEKEKMTPIEFARYFSVWHEIHWTVAATQEQADAILKDNDIAGEAHRICFETNQKNSDGFIGYWIGIEK